MARQLYIERSTRPRPDMKEQSLSMNCVVHLIRNMTWSIGAHHLVRQEVDDGEIECDLKGYAQIY